MQIKTGVRPHAAPTAVRQHDSRRLAAYNAAEAGMRREMRHGAAVAVAAAKRALVVRTKEWNRRSAAFVAAALRPAAGARAWSALLRTPAATRLRLVPLLVRGEARALTCATVPRPKPADHATARGRKLSI